MRQNRVNAEGADVGTDTFDRLIEWLLIALLTFMPFAFGPVEAWSEEVVIALAAAISVTFAAKLLFDPSARLVWSWAQVPVGLFIVVAVFQLVPLPQWAVAAISPHTAAIEEEPLGDIVGNSLRKRHRT